MTRVFTNGCFDLLHRGHVDLLRRARELGDHLTVAINSDDSVRRLKGPLRPVQHQEERAEILRGLRYVDNVIIFGEPTPIRLIKEQKPDVLVKGGDWPLDKIVGADIVRQSGGRVVSLPLLPGYSTTSVVNRLTGGVRRSVTSTTAEEINLIASVEESITVRKALVEFCSSSIVSAGRLLIEVLRSGRKILLFGNGGSASDAQHIAAELVGHYNTNRKALPAIALTADSSSVTAIGNDYGWNRIFSRQVQGLACSGDTVVAISTSGNSENVLCGVSEAKLRGCKTIGLTGRNGTRLSRICDIAVLVPSDNTARIQECHVTIGHVWSEMIDNALFGGRDDLQTY